MPVPFVIKITNVFDLRQHGWTESYFFQQNTNDLNLSFTSAQIIGQKRAALLGAEGRMKAIRCSIETDDAGLKVNGDSLLNYVQYNGNVGQPADEEDAALLITSRDLTSHKRRNSYLRGIWDIIDTSGGNYDPNGGGWASVLNSWIAANLGRGVGYLASSPGAKTKVTGYTAQPNGQVDIQCEAGTFGAPPYPDQIRVRFSKINGKSVLNGYQLVAPISDTHCLTVDQIGVTEFISEGFIQKYTFSFVQFASMQGQKIVTRRVGAPLLESRGRQRRRVRT